MKKDQKMKDERDEKKLTFVQTPNRKILFLNSKMDSFYLSKFIFWIRKGNSSNQIVHTEYNGRLNCFLKHDNIDNTYLS